MPNDELQVEELSAKFHEIYMVEARRQGDVRHKDAYADLPENIKEFDRVLARYVLALIERERDQAVQFATHKLDCGHPANCQGGDEYGHPFCLACQEVDQAVAGMREACAEQALKVRIFDAMHGISGVPDHGIDIARDIRSLPSSAADRGVAAIRLEEAKLWAASWVEAEGFSQVGDCSAWAEERIADLERQKEQR